MSGNNMGKISRKNLFEYFQLWRKGAANYSHKTAHNVNLSDKKHPSDNVEEEQILSETPKNKSTKNVIYSRSSPSSIIIEQNAPCPKDAYIEKRYEHDLAALKLSKCNETLRDYFSRQRMKKSVEESNSNKLPEMVTRLNEIMSLKVATTETKIKLKPDSLNKYHSGNRRNCFDFKPQSNCNVNRWQIKLPLRNEQKDRYESKDTLPEDSFNRLKKAKKLIEQPGAASEVTEESTPSTPSEDDEDIEETKSEENWQLGSVTIPRLDI